MIWLSLLWIGFIHADPAFTTGYRILHAAPQEVASALHSPGNGRIPKEAAATHKGQVASRMQQYFHVRRKSVRGDSVEMAIAPDVPLLTRQFGEASLLTVLIKEISQRENRFKYDVTIRVPGGQTVVTTMTIEPHISGSLMTLQLNKTSLLSKAFTQAALSLGFLELTPEGAEAKDRQAGNR